MITRFYANNYRCLVAFEANFDSFGVLCGPNGAGKSSVFDGLKLLRDFASGDVDLGENDFDIRRLELTEWLASKVQEFELEVISEGSRFTYKLQLEQTSVSEVPRVVFEQARCDKRVLFERNPSGVQFKKHDGTLTGFPLDWRRAGLGAIQPSGSLSEIELLKKELSRLLILRPSPHAIEWESRGESKAPLFYLNNLTSWYRSLSQEQEWTDALRESLRSVWPDFRSFKLVDIGVNSKVLQLRFDGVDLFFNSLSDGEKSIVALYMVHAALATGAVSTVVIDEPDNYVGLQELNPWVLAMRELLDESHQLLLISHHPEILRSSDEESGVYLWRDNHSSPTRSGNLNVPVGLTPAEAITRGWVGNG